jgi:hypothetical protein
VSDICLIIAGPTEPRMASLASRWHRGGSTGDMIWVMEFSDQLFSAKYVSCFAFFSLFSCTKAKLFHLL